jgi:beta-glucosidase
MSNRSLDLEMPGPPKHRSLENVKKAVEENKVDVKDIDKRVLANLKLLRNVGKFTDRRETPKEQAVDLPEHRALVREAGAEGIVLLKNENNTLPLDKSKLKKVAILGPLAKYAAAHGGGSASLNAHYKVTPFDALKQSFGDNVELNYSKGSR